MPKTSELLRNPWLLGAAYFASVMSAASVVPAINQDGLRLLAGALYAAGMANLALFGRYSKYKNPHLFLAVQFGLALAVILLPPYNAAALILLSILSVYIPLVLPTSQMVAWVAALLLVNTVYFVGSNGWPGLIDALSNGSGLVAYAVVGGALRRADLAHQQLREAQTQLQQLAVVEERNRLAREMHDSLGHRLTVAVVQLEGAQRLIPIDAERAARMIGAMRNEMKEALADLRQTVSALRTPLSDDRPLNVTLAQLTQTFGENTGLVTHFSASTTLPALPEAYRLAFYRAAQEALTNIQRHAQARQVWVTLQALAQEVILKVVDDGQGYGNQAPGNGLTGLRERAAQLGGRVEIGNQPEGGAQVVFAVPSPKP